MTQRFPFQDDVDLQGRKLENVADGTERSDGINLGQLQDATGTGVADYETQSNIPVTTAELTNERYVVRVQNNTETALGAATTLTLNGFTPTTLDISRGVGAGRFEYFFFALDQTTQVDTLNRNSNTVDARITFPGIDPIRIADEVTSHVGVTYDLSLESNSIDNAVDIRLTGANGTQDNVVVEGGDRITVEIDTNNRLAISAAKDDISLWRSNTAYSAGQIILRTAESTETVDGETIVVASAGGLFIASRNLDPSPTFSSAGLIPVPLTEVEWAGKLFDPRGFYERGDVATTIDGTTRRLWILNSTSNQDGRAVIIPEADRPDGSSGAWIEIMSGGGGHVIQDPDGTPLTQRANLQFTGNVTVTDGGSTANSTVVDITSTPAPYQVSIYRRSSLALTAAPTGGVVTLASATVTTPPSNWEVSIGDTSGSDQLYESVATINPATATGATVTPTWSTPFAVSSGNINTGVMQVSGDNRDPDNLANTQLNFGTGGLRELILDGQGNIRTAVSSSEINFNLELNIWATGQAYLDGELVRGSNNGIYQAVVNVNSGAGNNTADPVDATDESVWRRLGGAGTGGEPHVPYFDTTTIYVTGDLVAVRIPTGHFATNVPRTPVTKILQYIGTGGTSTGFAQDRSGGGRLMTSDWAISSDGQTIFYDGFNYVEDAIVDFGGQAYRARLTVLRGSGVLSAPTEGADWELLSTGAAVNVGRNAEDTANIPVLDADISRIEWDLFNRQVLALPIGTDNLGDATGTPIILNSDAATLRTVLGAQETLTTAQENVVNANPFTTADQTRLNSVQQFALDTTTQISDAKIPADIARDNELINDLQINNAVLQAFTSASPSSPVASVSLGDIGAPIEYVFDNIADRNRGFQSNDVQITDYPARVIYATVVSDTVTVPGATSTTFWTLLDRPASGATTANDDWTELGAPGVQISSVIGCVYDPDDTSGLGPDAQGFVQVQLGTEDTTEGITRGTADTLYFQRDNNLNEISTTGTDVTIANNQHAARASLRAASEDEIAALHNDIDNLDPLNDIPHGGSLLVY